MPKSRWISVSEKLPPPQQHLADSKVYLVAEENTIYLATYGYDIPCDLTDPEFKHYFMATYLDGCDDTIKLRNASHWQELPELPGKESIDE